MLLQEESQQVAFGGVSNSASLEALEQLTKLAAARGAKVAVDLTWAWLDGKNPSFPVFKDMQVGHLRPQKSSKALYSTAVHLIMILPGNRMFLAT